MGFFRVVEILPPLFPASRDKGDHIDIEQKIERFLEEARSIREHADLVLVADVKDPRMLKFSTLQAAAMIKDRLRMDAAPVIVARDFSRLQLLSTVLTGLSLDLPYMMLAWGDDYPRNARSTNVRDFGTLEDAIREAALIGTRARAATKLVAPVNLTSLATPRGLSTARGRLRAGAEYLLAQPPTTDPETFVAHASMLERADLKEKVLLNVFPFRDAADLKNCESYFGWRLPKRLHRASSEGGGTLFELESDVIRSLRSGGFPGVYLNTRGIPGVAEALLK